MSNSSGEPSENDASVPGKVSSLEDEEEELPMENALTPLTESLTDGVSKRSSTTDQEPVVEEREGSSEVPKSED